MPANKSALLRYRIIDACLTHNLRKYPSKRFIVESVEEQLGKSLSSSMFTKDIENMREMYNGPIKYNREEKGYCYLEPENLLHQIKAHIQDMGKQYK
jgi:hypothetical protein